MLNEQTLQFINDHEMDNVYTLALKRAPDNVDLKMALQQISARQIIKKKVPLWANNKALLYPKHLSLEQCSSETTARYKASLVVSFIGKSDFIMADMTGGLGIDCFFISQHASIAHYVERDTELCRIANHNFSILNKSITVHNQIAEDFISNNTNAHFDVVYLDPARRGIKGEKLISITDCQPDVSAILPDLFRLSDRIVVKLSPMLDIQHSVKELRNVRMLYVISVANECKELLLFLEKNYTSEPEICAVNLDTSDNDPVVFSGSMSDESLHTIHCSLPLNYLYEPYAAHIKSGLFKSLGARYNLFKLHPNSHLYTSSEVNFSFPGRIFRIIEIVNFEKQSAKQLFSRIRKANIATRNFPLSSEQICQKYNVKDGGNIYLFATTTVSDHKILIVCEKISLLIND